MQTNKQTKEYSLLGQTKQIWPFWCPKQIESRGTIKPSLIQAKQRSIYACTHCHHNGVLSVSFVRKPLDRWIQWRLHGADTQLPDNMQTHTHFAYRPRRDKSTVNFWKQAHPFPSAIGTRIRQCLIALLLDCLSKHILRTICSR